MCPPPADTVARNGDGLSHDVLDGNPQQKPQELFTIHTRHFQHNILIFSHTHTHEATMTSYSRLMQSVIVILPSGILRLFTRHVNTPYQTPEI